MSWAVTYTPFPWFMLAGSESHTPNAANHVNILWFHNRPTFLSMLPSALLSQAPPLVQDVCGLKMKYSSPCVYTAAFFYDESMPRENGQEAEGPFWRSNRWTCHLKNSRARLRTEPTSANIIPLAQPTNPPTHPHPQKWIIKIVSNSEWNDYSSMIS